MSKEIITIYEPDSRHRISFLKIWIVMIKNIVSSRELIIQLFLRDFLMTYKKSFLGIGWLIIQPIIAIISWILMNSTGILQPGDVGIPYPAYVLLSSSIWGLFMGFFTSASETLGAGSGFIMQVKYPHEVLLIKQSAQQLANFIIAFIINIIVLLYFGIIPSWKIIFFPFLIVPLFLLAASIGLIVSLFAVIATDIQKGLTAIMQILMYFTPIIYSSNVQDATLQKITKWNPLTYLVGSVRDMIIYGKIEDINRYIYASIFSLLLFLISWRLFFLSEEKVIEKMI